MQTRIWIQLYDQVDESPAVRWCLAGAARSELHAAPFEEFKQWLVALQTEENHVLRATLLLSGEQVMTRSVAFAANEKKHLQKLLPFMLESQLAVDLSQVHVAYGLPKQPVPADSDKSLAQVAYVDRKQLQWRIALLESLGLEVEQVFSIAAMLPATDASWSLVLDTECCHVHAGSLVCTTVDLASVPIVLDLVIAGLPGTTPMPALTVFHAANDASRVSTLISALKDSPVINKADIDIQSRSISHVWTDLDHTHPSAVNLRQGEFAAPLRVGKVWQQWRVPAMAAMLAVSLVLLAAIIETQLNQYRSRALEARIEQRYREVMPDGVLVDAVQQLTAQVLQRRNQAATQSLTGMLDDMLQPFEEADSIVLHRLGFSADTGAQAGAGAEIQLNISAPSATEILQLSENLTAAGWTAQAQNISRVGDTQQANLIVRGRQQ